MKKKLPPIAILAGGLATRMRPLTETAPKAMLEVAGEPFVAHQLRLLAQQGIRSVVLCLGYLGAQIEDFVGDGAQYNLNVAYSYDGSAPLGTGGALRNALPLLGDTFLVTYGDAYLRANLYDVFGTFEAETNDALMVVYKNQNKWDPSNVKFREGKVIIYDKSRSKPEDLEYIDWGMGVLSRKTFNDFAHRTSFDLAEIYQNLVTQEKMAGFEVFERFYEIGSTEGLETLELLLQNNSGQKIAAEA
jgi:MurNAc alpha-1-phosphate uridylyltransferase